MLLKSGLDTGTAAAFLHENMLEFVDNEAMEETAQAYSYLSHTGAYMHAFILCRYKQCNACIQVVQSLAICMSWVRRK